MPIWYNEPGVWGNYKNWKFFENFEKFQFSPKKCFDKKLYEHINIKKCYVRKNVKSTKKIKIFGQSD